MFRYGAPKKAVAGLAGKRAHFLNSKHRWTREEAIINPEKTVEVVLQPAYRKFNYIYIPARETKSFPIAPPGTRIPIRVETGDRSWDAELQYNSKAHV